MFLDHAAGAPVRPEVVEAMTGVLISSVPNPSGAHGDARKARAKLEDARETVASLLGVTSRQIVFTAGGTESCNLALASGRDISAVCVSTIEHVAVSGPAARRARRGAQLVHLSVDDRGVLDLDAALRDIPDGALVSVMTANNETGAIQPVAELAQALRERRIGIVLHTDAIAAAPTMDLRAVVGCCDLVSIAGHKIGGPAGAGVLVVKESTSTDGLIIGGGQEGGHRAGTENVAAAVGLSVALELTSRERGTGNVESMARRRDALEALITDGVDGAEITSRDAPRLAGHAHVTVPGVVSEELLVLLDRHDIAASAGAACSSGAPQVSHVLTAMGMDASRARGALRLTLGPTTSDAEVETAGAAVVEAVAQLRR